MKFIVLLGPKHSGKTSAGRELATLLSCGFVDLDEVITERNGKIPRVLYTEGPQIFRKTEAEALAAVFKPETADSSPQVIASGGGLADNPTALTLLEQNAAAISVFLDISPDTAWERICKAGALPPFLESGNSPGGVVDKSQIHRSLHERRSAVYRQLASLVIRTDGKSPGNIAREIFDRLPELIR